MNYTIVAILGYSLFIAAILAIIRFPRIDKRYRPFLVLLWVGIANELFGEVVIRMGHSNAVNANIYSLLESILITYFFKSMGLFDKKKTLFLSLLGILVTSWVVENFFITSIYNFNSYFIVIYSFSVVLMSIDMINRLIATGKTNLLKNALFLICIGFILFFTYTLLIEIFWIYGLDKSKEFRRNIYRILSFINLAVNLIYTLAVLWMPPKQKSILL